MRRLVDRSLALVAILALASTGSTIVSRAGGTVTKYKGRAAIACLVATLLLALAAPGADALQLYWTVDDKGSVGRASFDKRGTPLFVQPLFIDGLGGFSVDGAGDLDPSPFFSPGGVAIDDSHIYWTSGDDDSGFDCTPIPGACATNTIGRANLDGSGVNKSFIAGFIDGRDFPVGVAVSDSHIYWANESLEAIGRANIDGSGVNPTFITGARFPHGVAVDGGHIYWTNFPSIPGRLGSIGRANLSGTSVDQDFITIGGDVVPRGVAVDQSHIYWTTTEDDTSIGRAKIDGTNVRRSFIRGLTFPFGIAVDRRHIYWAAWGTSSIGRANLDGSGVNERFGQLPHIPGGPIRENLPTDVAVDPKPGFANTEVKGGVSARKTQRQRGKNRIAVKIKVRAKERLSVRASGKVRVTAVSFKLAPKRTQLAKDKKKTLTLKPKRRKDGRKIASALRRGRAASARLQVALTDLAGNTATEKLKVRLRA